MLSVGKLTDFNSFLKKKKLNLWRKKNESLKKKIVNLFPAILRKTKQKSSSGPEAGGGGGRKAVSTATFFYTSH